MLRDTDMEISNLYVMAREDHSLTLARKQDKKPEELHLYGVLISGPFTVDRLHVLAESEEGAISQARRALKLEKHWISSEEDQQIVTVAKHLPLVIRGWSDNRF